ncbi:unnamed protein product [Cyclocybe aegerita]|uniref:Uncharacterized protein n=1 Tax=Cyclocybe aegerita TaxID=1973307 RepID=A0A8S0WBP5_CYCAE|nr:unnamed protein product [Cyclocybe aegerita]
MFQHNIHARFAEFSLEPRVLLAILAARNWASFRTPRIPRRYYKLKHYPITVHYYHSETDPPSLNYPTQSSRPALRARLPSNRVRQSVLGQLSVPFPFPSLFFSLPLPPLPLLLPPPYLHLLYLRRALRAARAGLSRLYTRRRREGRKGSGLRWVQYEQNPSPRKLGSS